MGDEKQTKDKATGKGLYPVLPLRDIVVFPHMVVPLFVGREKSIHALEEVMRATSRSCSPPRRTPATTIRADGRIYRRRHARHRAAAAEAARRHREGAGRGQARARASRASPQNATTTRPRSTQVPRRTGAKARGRGARTLGRQPVRELREAQQEGPARGPGQRPADRRTPRKLADTIASHLAVKIADKQQLLEIVDDLRAARARLRADGGRDHGAAGREEDPLAREAPDGEDAARVLPERADEGDPEGAGRHDDERDEIVELEEQIKNTKLSQGGPRQGQDRAEEAQADEPDVGRSHGGAQLPRLAAVDPVGHKGKVKKRPRRGRADPRRRPLRPREGQGAHPRVPRGAGAHQQAEGADPLPRRAARRRQDLARQVDRAKATGREFVRLSPRRRARRGGDPRPPAHLHRLDARQDHPVDEEGEDAPIRCSCSTRSTRWAPTSAAIPRRRCSRCSIPSRTTRSTTTTSRSTTTCRT